MTWSAEFGSAVVTGYDSNFGDPHAPPLLRIVGIGNVDGLDHVLDAGPPPPALPLTKSRLPEGSKMMRTDPSVDEFLSGGMSSSCRITPRTSWASAYFKSMGWSWPEPDSPGFSIDSITRRIVRSRPAVSVTRICRDFGKMSTLPCGPSSLRISCSASSGADPLQRKQHFDQLKLAALVDFLHRHLVHEVRRNLVLQIDQDQHPIPADQGVALGQEDAVQQIDGLGRRVLAVVGVVERPFGRSVGHERQVGVLGKPVEDVLPRLVAETELQEFLVLLGPRFSGCVRRHIRSLAGQIAQERVPLLEIHGVGGGRGGRRGG